MQGTAPRPFVFVLMPFDAKFDDVYKFGIKEASERAGAYCERVDEQIFVENMLSRIYNQIAKADIIVADMSGRNQNVFYEVGYAHALGKIVILATKEAGDIPFDLKHYPHIVYGDSIRKLADEVERHVSYFIEHPSGVANKPFPLVLHVNGEPYQDGMVARSNYVPDGAPLEIGFHNSSEVIYDGGHYAGLEGERGTFLSGWEFSLLPEGRQLCNFGNIGVIYPGAWRSFRVTVHPRTEEMVRAHSCELTARVFTETGPLSYPFRLTW